MTNTRLKSLIMMLLLVCFSMCGIAQKGNKKEKSMDEMWGETSVSVDAFKVARGKLIDEATSGCLSIGDFSQIWGQVE